MITLKDHLRAKGQIVMTTEDIEEAKKFRQQLPPFKMIIRDELEGGPWPWPSLAYPRKKGFEGKVKVIETKK